MKKNRPTLPMKGLHTPRLLTWTHGFMHGKIMHTGGIDPETNVIASGYVTGQLRRFRSACVTRREEADKKLSGLWGDADALLIDYTTVTAAIADADRNMISPCESNAQARSNERTTARRASHEAERQTILKNLSKIVNDIRTEYDTVYDQMEATSELLASTFACYGHGLLMKPVYPNNLPVLNYEDCAQQLIVNHEETWNAIVSLLKEVKK